MRIVFLDIDGVLLSRAAWDLPANTKLLLENERRAMSTSEFSSLTTFDPVAVMLVNRLCRRTGARLVLCTTWRYSYGAAETRAKLVEQGIEEGLFHESWSCPEQTPIDKSLDIMRWLEDACSVQDFVALDDEALSLNQVRVDGIAGFGAHDYRLACMRLGGEDRAYGVPAVSAEDMARVARAFAGADQAWKSIQWLCALRDGHTRASFLDRSAARSRNLVRTEADRAATWEELPEMAT